MSIYAPISRSYIADSITAPLPQTVIKTPFKPVKFGPLESTLPPDYNGPRIDTLNPPRYIPEKSTAGQCNISGNSFPCLTRGRKLRYEYETMPLESGNSAGGFDSYNINDIPSCGEREGGYLTFYDFSNPFARIYVKDDVSQRNDVIINSHVH